MVVGDGAPRDQEAPGEARTLAFLHVDRGAFADDAVLVALTPAAYQSVLERSGRPTVPADHVRPADVLLDADGYHRWQADWFARLDGELRDGDGSLLSATHLLKTPVDSVVASARVLRGVVAAVGADRLLFVGPPTALGKSPWHDGHIQFSARLGDPPLAALLLPLIARQVGLDLSTRSASPLGAQLGRPGRPTLRRRVARLLGPYARARPTLRRASGPATAMLWTNGYGARVFTEDERSARRRLVLLARRSPTRLIEVDRPLRRHRTKTISVDPLPPTEPNEEIKALLQEVDEWAGLPGSGQVLASRLAFLVHSICPVIDRAAEGLRSALVEGRVTRMAAANPSSIEEFACLLAAGRNGGIRRVLLQHGDHLFAYDNWLLTETQSFDELATSDPTVAPSLRGAGARLGLDVPECRAYAPRVTELVRRARLRPDAASVFYVPCFLGGDSTLIGSPRFEDAWYHRWHLRLLDLMASRPEVQFVWKGLPSSDAVDDPVPGLISARRLPNVRYEARPLVTVVTSTARFFTDFPSTALFEAVHLGLPVLALWFPRFGELRPEARQLFGPVLRECEDEDQAIGALRSFVDDEPARWTLARELLVEA